MNRSVRPPASAPTSGSPRLGPFVLDRPIGAGGQGTVWRATHPETGLAVAIKVLANLRAREARARAMFRREVRAAAGLDHPNVLVVLDQGEVTAEVERLTEGALLAGSPWLAMELARSSLFELPGRRTWPETRALLTALLSALAHAHARGLVHRDLKPANVLFQDVPARSADFRHACLADFGLAFGVDDPTFGHVVAGTPVYMAPEQMQRDVSRVGPGADLYALAWMGWELVVGGHPFAGKTLLEIRDLKQGGWLPELPEGAAAPDGFSEWAWRLLDRDPRRRPRFAADALAALEALPEDAPLPSQSVERPASQRFVQLYGSDALPSGQATWTDDGSAWETVEVARPGSGLAPLPPAPVPAHWDREEAARPPGLVGAGLGLMGLRQPDPVGRAVEQARLWKALGAAKGQVVLLRGGEGEGVSTLGRWFVQRAAEVGAAETLWIAAGPRAATPGVGGALTRRFRLGLARPSTARNVLDAALNDLGLDDPVDRVALQGVVGLGPAAPSAERVAALAHLGQALAAERPLLVFVDDAPFAEEDLEWLGRVRGREGVLIVLGALDADLAARPEVAAAIAAWDADVIQLGPLPPGDARELVRRILGVDPGLLHGLVERAAGNPAFLVNLLRDWVARGILEPAPEGFRLAAGALPSLPEDVRAAWEARLLEVDEHCGRLARPALEVAAALGLEVPRAAWLGAVARLGFSAPADLEDHLLDRGLARPAPDPAWGFHLAHAGLRECLLRGAQEAGRAAQVHLACARELAQEAGDPGAIGVHLARAGHPEEAAPLLVEGAAKAVDAHDPARARGLVELARTCLEGRPAEDRRVLELGVLEGRLAVREGRFAAAASGLEPVIAAARAARRLDIELAARSWRAAAAMGALDLATAETEASAVLAAGAGGPALRMRLLLGQAAAARGDHASADQCFAQVVELAGDEGDLLAQALVGRMGAARARGAIAEALGYGARAAEHLAKEGNRRRLAQVHNERGDLLRAQGDLAGAVSAYTESERLFAALGLAHATVPRINLGLTHVEAGRYEVASRVLRHALAEVRAQGHEGYELVVRYGLLPCAAAAGALAEHAEHVARIAALQASALADADLARAAERAGDLWSRRGGRAAAVEAWGLAAAQWRRLGRESEAGEVEGKVSAFG